MPMIVDPSAPHITPPSPVVSPDGWFKASVDTLYAGVVLAVDYTVPTDTAQNLALNPSLENDLTNTVTLGANVSRARITSDAKYGSACAEHTHTGAASQAGSLWLMPEQGPGTELRISFWVKVVSGAPATGYIALRLGTNTPIQIPLVSVPAAGAWTRLDATYTLGPGESADRFGIALNGSSGTVWRADGAMCEPGLELHDYVDGDQPGCVWQGTAHASTSQRVTSAVTPETIRKVRITRTDPGRDPVPVRSADLAWAIGGVGAAYDHEAPLGAAVVYTATAVRADGSDGPTSALAVMVPEPAVPADVWIKSVDEPGLSARVTVTAWPQLQWESRIDTADVAGSRYAATAQDVYASAGSDISIDAQGDQIEALRTLLTTPGVRLIQTRSANRRPDQFVLFATPTESVDTTPDATRTFTAAVREVERPGTANQPLRIPGWSYDHLAAQYASYSAVESTFGSYLALATNGVFT
ncbi:hypothetical protein ACIP25_11715 [Streptomyces massasporeus]|uniref:hypothetical protein n=1 Tax=Streptomyces massasporeus TaxID=67324 RepID=UPI003810F35F